MLSDLVNKQKELIVLEVANNHQGDAEHGLNIIKSFSEINKNFTENFNFAFKFQYRNLNTFIHKNFKDSEIKYVRRFLDTQLKKSEWNMLIDAVKSEGFLTMCTPFDEDSVDDVIKDQYDILKIASASIDDWPLIEKIGESNKKEIIASIGGASIEKAKRFYSYMSNKNKDLALNYCVSLYPTSKKDLNLSYIKELSKTFPSIPIGFSTHETGEVDNSAGLALAAGAVIFEKHIALENKEKGYGINDYSVNLKQYNNWIESLVEAKTIIGSVYNRNENLDKELDALRDLKRGVFAKTDIAEDSLNSENVYFSIPSNKNQLLSNDLSKFNEIRIKKEIKTDEAISYNQIKITNTRPEIEKIRDIIRDDLVANNISIPQSIDLEISHHYGIENFAECGTCMLTLVNKDYCKKILYQFPNQKHPEHYHKIKEETFIILVGSLNVTVEEKKHELKKGDILTIERGQKHSFESNTGAIFEEISTEHLSDDSYYTDEKIQNNLKRKSKIMLFNI
tara:strand:+ start:1808 stop:3331 length:1524 start_codon:yes stop_codon:yes gene_type:complete